MVQDEVEMCIVTTFGPFHKDEIINESYMSHYFIPNHVITKWTQCTNKYAQDNCNRSKIREKKEHHILQFLAIYYYMGVVYLPAKRVYWKEGRVWLAHLVTLWMRRGTFEFIF